MAETTFSIKSGFGWFIEWLANDATALAQGNGYNSDSQTDRNVRNALAHAHTSALVTFDTGRNIATLAGNLKELAPGGDDPDDMYKDEYNNEVGRRIAEYAKDHNLTKEDLDDLMIDALNNGQLITELDDPRIENLIPPD